MVAFLIRVLLILRSALNTRSRLEAENLVLRQQVVVLSRKCQGRVRLRNGQRLLFVWLYRLFPSIVNAIVIIKPETLIRWHRRGFQATGVGSRARAAVVRRSIATFESSSGE